ncbi:hypothetical protein IFM89_018608 [Coptis chinensis]|uniref:DNA topoisomerase n=1 Tax=Coptis chinensis TaxID=261450 RepID=A0A835LJ17_9MAGN|nr:hypothetical protein IFM89_018608 [Coptis chinensis]
MEYSSLGFPPVIFYTPKEIGGLEKKLMKEEKMKQEEKYMWAIVDSVKEKVGNFRVEPPGLFHGHGEHPKIGKLKKRIRPRDITINIGKGAPVPECSIPSERWKEVKHDNTVTWLAFWNDPINPKEFKYVFLAASSSLKGQSDKEKYEKARLLKEYIENIRVNYAKDFTNKDVVKRQVVVATYLIDKLALRVGNEKRNDIVQLTISDCQYKCVILHEWKDHLIWKEPEEENVLEGEFIKRPFGSPRENKRTLGSLKFLSGVINNDAYPVLCADYMKRLFPILKSAMPRTLSIMGSTLPRRWLTLGKKGKKTDWTLYFITLFWNLNFWDNASTLAGEVDKPQSQITDSGEYSKGKFLKIFNENIPEQQSISAKEIKDTTSEPWYMHICRFIRKLYVATAAMSQTTLAATIAAMYGGKIHATLKKTDKETKKRAYGSCTTKDEIVVPAVVQWTTD